MVEPADNSNPYSPPTRLARPLNTLRPLTVAGLVVATLLASGIAFCCTCFPVAVIAVGSNSPFGFGFAILAGLAVAVLAGMGVWWFGLRLATRRETLPVGLTDEELWSEEGIAFVDRQPSPAAPEVLDSPAPSDIDFDPPPQEGE